MLGRQHSLFYSQDVAEQGLANRDFVVLASDGLWDVLSNQEVGGLYRSRV